MNNVKQKQYYIGNDKNVKVVTRYEHWIKEKYSYMKKRHAKRRTE